jgi:hypothetical protein
MKRAASAPENGSGWVPIELHEQPGSSAKLRRVRIEAASHLSEAADRLDYWMWNEGWEGCEPESLARLVRDLRAAVVLIRGGR